MKYNRIGNKIVKDGKTYYSQGSYGDGLEEGYIFKDDEAFYEHPDEVCYIPENSFDDAEFITINGENFYLADDLCKYTRKMLEEMVDGEMDEDGEYINVEYFYRSLYWCFPETRLQEIIYA